MDLHRHDQFSMFDGFGKPSELAKIAKDKGYTWLGISNHGTTAGNIQHYFACKAEGIKPIMGVECYHNPVWDNNAEKKERKSFHLCLFAKNIQGYKNMNKIMTEAENNKYYVSRVTFDILRKYSEGIIVTSACVAGYASQAILNNQIKKAVMWLKKMKSIFGDDFYIEIQPYVVDTKGTQERVNHILMSMADKLGIECILTSDSHRGLEEDFASYIKMHEVANHDRYDITATYKERYMPERVEMYKRFIHMHGKRTYRIDNAKETANRYMLNLVSLTEKVEPDILDQIPLKMPVFDYNIDSGKELMKTVQRGLKKANKTSSEYVKRAKHELKVIHTQGFDDYFMIVSDYVNWAKEQGIVVGHGRGSVCNSLVAYASGITGVDPIRHNLDFNRFMREGKKKIPDIDLDFMTSRRDEVIKYLNRKYEGRCAQVSAYGMYRIDGLLNDLFKVCGVEEDHEKRLLKKYVKNALFYDDELLDYDHVCEDDNFIEINREYDNLLDHFYHLNDKIRYYGTHAAGVAIAPDDITDYTALRKDKKGTWACVHDLVDLEMINVVKFDLLGLTTLDQLADMRKQTGVGAYDEEWEEDGKVIEVFREGATDGVFQFDRQACKDILTQIQTDSFNDIIATNAMNRPAALSMRMPDKYAEAKLNNNLNHKAPYAKYVKETYGCIIYQEQVLAIAINIGGFTPDEADILVKMEHNAGSRTKRELDEKYYEDFREKFIENAMAKGVEDAEAAELFDSCAQYGFNKGHATGYSMTSLEEAHFLKYYTPEYFYVKIKYAKNDADREMFCAKAVANDIVVFPPHVNYSMSKTTMRIHEGEWVIQKGLSSLKGVGEKAGDYITDERKCNGIFHDAVEFENRCRSRAVTSKVITILEENGSLDFHHKQYIKRTKKYNRTLYMKGTK